MVPIRMSSSSSVVPNRALGMWDSVSCIKMCYILKLIKAFCTVNSKILGENFIFMNNVIRHIYDIQNSRLEHDLHFLFDLILYVPSTIFQLYSDGSSWVEPVLS